MGVSFESGQAVRSTSEPDVDRLIFPSWGYEDQDEMTSSPTTMEMSYLDLAYSNPLVNVVR